MAEPPIGNAVWRARRSAVGRPGATISPVSLPVVAAPKPRPSVACNGNWIARASQLFLPTLRDAPADAEAISHKLLVRGGYIRQVGAGLWTFLPLGWRVHRKVEQIIREEMDAIGAQERLRRC